MIDNELPNKPLSDNDDINPNNLEERKVKAEETRNLQMEEVRKSQEIASENLKELNEKKPEESQDQEKTN